MCRSYMKTVQLGIKGGAGDDVRCVSLGRTRAGIRRRDRSAGSGRCRGGGRGGDDGGVAVRDEAHVSAEQLGAKAKARV